MLVFPMVTHVGELVGVLQLINRQQAGRAGEADRGHGAGRSRPVRQGDRRADALARRAGGGRRREQPSLRIDRAALRRLRHRRSHRDRAARSDDLRSFVPRGRSHRRAGARRRPRRREVPRRPLHLRTGTRDPLRVAAPRLRQSRRPRAGAGQGEEALSAAARNDPRTASSSR